jgi:hypothetical protein
MKDIDPKVVDRFIEKLCRTREISRIYLTQELLAEVEKEEIERKDLRIIEQDYITFLSYHDLVELKEDGILAVRPKGRAVFLAGGWENYSQQQEQKQERERIRQEEAHQAILRSTTATEHSARSADSSAKAAWLAGVVAVVSIVFSVGQILWSGSNQQDLSATKAELNELKAQLRSLSQQVQKQKAIHSENSFRLDSLPNPKMKKK